MQARPETLPRPGCGCGGGESEALGAIPGWKDGNEAEGRAGRGVLRVSEFCGMPPRRSL